jgi:hypothetical protein
MCQAAIETLHKQGYVIAAGLKTLKKDGWARLGLPLAIEEELKTQIMSKVYYSQVPLNNSVPYNILPVWPASYWGVNSGQVYQYVQYDQETGQKDSEHGEHENQESQESQQESQHESHEHHHHHHHQHHVESEEAHVLQNMHHMHQNHHQAIGVVDQAIGVVDQGLSVVDPDKQQVFTKVNNYI